MDNIKTLEPLAQFRWFVSGGQKVLQQASRDVRTGEKQWDEIVIVIDKTWDGHTTDRRPV